MPKSIWITATVVLSLAIVDYVATGGEFTAELASGVSDAF